jgi:hypothetical protein
LPGLLLVLSAGCLEPVTAELMAKLDQSVRVWRDVKEAHGASYTYRVRFRSWTGFGSDTTIYVSADVVVRRDYSSFDRDEQGVTHPVDAWSELGEQVGGHPEGASPVTIDVLYTQCADALKQDTATNRLFFETEPSGVMRRCGFVPDNCADDCFNGVRIETLVFDEI